MPEEQIIMGPLADVDREVTRIGKGVTRIENTSKKSNNLLLAILKFMQSNLGRQITERDIDDDSDELIFDLESVVEANIQQLNAQTEKQISVIDAETKAQQKRADIEVATKKRILSEETKEKLRQNLIAARAKKEELRLQREEDSRTGKYSPERDLNDLEREQQLTRKEIAKLSKKERKEIYKAQKQEKTERGLVGTSKSQLHTAKKSEKGTDADKNGLDYFLEDAVDWVKKKKRKKEKPEKVTTKKLQKNTGNVADAIGSLTEALKSQTGQSTEEEGSTLEDVLNSAKEKYDEYESKDDESGKKDSTKNDRLERHKKRQRRIRNKARKQGLASRAKNLFGTVADKIQSTKAYEIASNVGESVVEKSKKVGNKIAPVKEKVLGSFGSAANTAKDVGGKLVESGSNVISKVTPMAESGLGVGGKLLKGIGVAGAALTAIDLASRAKGAYDAITDENTTSEEKSVAGATFAGGAAGAALGGAVGALLGPVGMAAGAALGEQLGSEGASALAESISNNPEMSDAIGRVVAVPMAAFSEDARKALAHDFEETANELQLSVIDPIKKLPEKLYNEVPDSVKNALGVAVAVPMSIVSEDARKALTDDWNNKIIPNFTSSVIDPLNEFGQNFGDYFDRFAKSASLIGEGLGQAGTTLLGGIRGAFAKGAESLRQGGGIGTALSSAGAEIGKSYDQAKGIVSEKFTQAYDTYKDKAAVTIERYQKDLGITKEQAAGIVGNFGHESAGMQAGINEKKPLVAGSRGGYGWAQWTGPRRKALEAFAAERGMPVDSDETQYQFSIHELQTTHKNALERLKGTNTVEDATRTFFAAYESGGDPRAVPNMAQRLKYANIGYAANTKESPLSPTSLTSSPISSGIPSSILNTTLASATQTAIDNGVKYSYGAKDSTSGVIDCSGWVAEINRQIATSMSEPSVQKSVETITSGAAKGGAAGILQASYESGGGLLKNEQVTPESLKEGMVIGLDAKASGAKSGSDRFLGIDHVAQVIKDPATGQMMVTESSSSKGVHTTPAAEWLANYNKKGANIYASNPYAPVTEQNPSVVGYTPTGYPAESANVQQSIASYYTPASYTGMSAIQPNTLYKVTGDNYTSVSNMPNAATTYNAMQNSPTSFSDITTTQTTAGSLTVGSVTINAGSVSVNGTQVANSEYANTQNVANQTGYASSVNAPQEKSFFESLFSGGQSTAYSPSYSYGGNPVSNAVSAITNVPQAIMGGIFGNLMGNVSSAVNAPANIIGGITNSAQSYTNSMMSLPMNAARNSMSAVTNTVNAPVNVAKSAVGMANSTLSMPLNAYSATNNAVSSMYNLPTAIANNTGGYSYSTNKILPEPNLNFGNPISNSLNSLSSLTSYSSPQTFDSVSNFRSASENSVSEARITEALPAPYSVDRSQYEPLSMQMPEINFPEMPMPAPPQKEPNVRQADSVTNFDANRSSQTHRPTIDEIPINISDSGIMLLNIGYV